MAFEIKFVEEIPGSTRASVDLGPLEDLVANLKKNPGKAALVAEKVAGLGVLNRLPDYGVEIVTRKAGSEAVTDANGQPKKNEDGSDKVRRLVDVYVYYPTKQQREALDKQRAELKAKRDARAAQTATA